MTDIFAELGWLFESRDRRLFLVGGSVRDMLLDRDPKDLDFTTDALPDEIEDILKGWADSIWDVGREFGTIAAQKDGQDIEITTFRFDGPGRKPEVTFTDSLVEDLQRRDFSINAMAMHVDHLGLHNHASDIEDPFGGLVDLQQGVLSTPTDPQKTFTEDPLRMLRAARFAAQLGFTVVDTSAIRENAHLIQTISAERIAAEMDKLLMGENEVRGLIVLQETGLLDFILPEADRVGWVLLGDDVETRWADLLLDVEPEAVEKRLRALKFSTDRVRTVTNLVRWHNKFQGLIWFKPEIRRVMAAAGEDFPRLVQLLRASDTLLPLAAALEANEGPLKPLLTGKQVMDALGIKPGPLVGEALEHLWNVRLELGPLKDEDVRRVLTHWAETKGLVTV